MNLKEELAFVYERALLVVLPDQVACDLRPDVGINKTVERANPFAVNRNIPLFDLRHHNVRRSSRSSARRTFRTKGSSYKTNDTQTRHARYSKVSPTRTIH